MKKNKKHDEDFEQEEIVDETDYAEADDGADGEKAEKSKKNLNLNDFNDVGHNIVNNVLSLYRSGKYFREKEFMAKKLLEVGYEAGRSVSRVAISNAYAKDAKKSIDDLVFLLDTMLLDNIYTRHRVSNTMEAIEIANNLLSKCVYVDEQPYVQSYENGSYLESNIDGFNDDYFG